MRNLLQAFAIGGWLSFTAAHAFAIELLTNPNLELPAAPPGWSISESVTGDSAAVVDSAELVEFANREGEFPGSGMLGFWLKPFSGNLGSYAGQNKQTNAALSQAVAVTAAAGQTYTFTGFSKWEQNYSGGVINLDPASPSGEVPSPTNSIWEMAFLNGGGEVIQPPVTFDLRTPVAQGGQQIDGTWRQHTLSGVAPSGTVKVRVTAPATNMVFNVDPQQSGFYDNFSLKGNGAPTTELLTNGNLNSAPVTSGWFLIRSPNTLTAEFKTGDFANHTAPGNTGVWLKPFATTDPVGQGIATQTVAGVANGNYTFSAFSKWEQNYTGATAGSPTLTFLEMAFLDGADTPIGTPLTLDLRAAGQIADANWHPFSLNGMSPVGTVSVRVRAGANNMFNNVTNPQGQSAFFDDFSLMLATDQLGDYNHNGKVDAADYVVWRKTNINGQQGYTDWRANFGAPGGGTGVGLNAGSVPEPSCYLLASIAGMIFVRLRRR